MMERPILLVEDNRDEVELALNALRDIVKPTDFAIFVATVRQIGTCWLSLNEPSPIQEHENAKAIARFER